MNILIVEDEPQAAQRLERLIAELVPSAVIQARFDTIKKTVAWLEKNPPPDLVLMDIQLADGISFQIFERVEVKSPVIFTTAYDEYALKAFKVNSIDYILKPVDKEELKAAIRKMENLGRGNPATGKLLENLQEVIGMLHRKYKTRFVIKVGEHLKTVEVAHIRYFFSQDKATFCVSDENRNFILDFTLEQLEEMLDPRYFFRISRKYIIRTDAIQDIISYTNSRLRLVLKGSSDTDIIVARERVQEFKEWLDR